MSITLGNLLNAGEDDCIREFSIGEAYTSSTDDGDVCLGTRFETCFGIRTLIITCNATICMMQALTYGGNIATPTGGPRNMEFWAVWPGPCQCLAAATSSAASQIMHPHAHSNNFHIRNFFCLFSGRQHVTQHRNDATLAIT